MFTINLVTPLPDIPLAALTINNNQLQGITIKGNNSFRIFTLVNSAVVTISNLTISHGFGNNGLGGGIFMGNSSTLNLIGSTVSNNTATANSGGIYMFDSSTLNINASTVNANIAGNGGNGGSVYNGTSGTVNAVNSTIDSNSAGLSGGIYNTATITLTNNTVTSNTAVVSGGGIYNNFVATLNNNLVSLNTATDGKDLLGHGSLGQAFTRSHNLIGNADGSEGLGATTNQLGSTPHPIDPRIGVFRDNGGATLTRAVLTRSPAIDRGNSPAVITDQGGEVRPYDNALIPNAASGNGADIGAFERTFSPTRFDFDADGKADIAVFRPSAGGWWINHSSSGQTNAFQFGQSTDKPVPADFTGDGKTDIAFFRPSSGEWFILRSEDSSFLSFPFGTNGDVPLVGDFDADGKADGSIFRPTTKEWFLQVMVTANSIRLFFAAVFGISSKAPAAF